MGTQFYTAFDGHRRIAAGPLQQVALVVKRAVEGRVAGPVLIFADTTGRSIEIDTRGSEEEVLARLAQRTAANERAGTAGSERQPRFATDSVDADVGHADVGHADVGNSEPRGRGRPKLGVVAREVTLLPRHWEWLATQPGGASVALRKLVEEARRTHAEKDRRRNAQERAFNFLSAIAGNMPGFEEATRALFANDQRRFRELVAEWSADVRDHAIALAFGDDRGASPANP